MGTSEEFLVTVFESGNRIEMEMAMLLLRDAEIEYFTVGEEAQDLIAPSRLGTGVDPVTGRARIQVRVEDEAEAKRVLGEMDVVEPDS